MWVGKDEDEIMEAIEAAEGEKDFGAIVSIMNHSIVEGHANCELAEAACDALLRCRSAISLIFSIRCVAIYVVFCLYMQLGCWRH